MPPLDDYAGLMSFIDEWETPQAKFVGALLHNIVRPKSVIDWGCASGLYLIPFKRRGCSVFGIDSEPTAGKALEEQEFIQSDIRLSTTIARDFDLALCIEVAEHLQPEYADTLVENVANSANTVFWSAASPGQGGQNHYNEQPQWYWIKKFIERGFERHSHDEYVEKEIRESPACQKVQWLIPNSVLLTRGK
jgi:SAM-dependent methyltransferase